MKNRFTISITLVMFSCMIVSISKADSNVVGGPLEGNGTVTVEGRGNTDPIDPENPDSPADPGEGPSTDGSLRFDFVSSLNFGNAKITSSDREYFSQAQLFHSDTAARGAYVQITDERKGSTGWTLQVKQSYQFKNDVIQNVQERELNGAVLSFDKGWANAFNPANPPVVTRDTINLTNVGNYYDVARADEGSGYGTWIIEFGASEENKGNQGNTLKPLVDENGEPIIDSVFNKQAYSNSAISLKIPDSTKIYPVQYQTELTWLLAELP